MLVEAVDDRAIACQSLLELRQPLLDASPPGGDEVDEEGEVVDAGMPLGEDVAFDSLEPADDLVGQAAHLGEMARHGQHLLAEPVLDRVADPRGQARLELGRGRRECLDLKPGPLERRVDARLAGSLARLREVREALKGV